MLSTSLDTSSIYKDISSIGLLKLALTIFVAFLPIANLYAWENYTLFNTALTHRLWIVTLELLVLFGMLFFTPTNLIKDLKARPILGSLICLFCVWGFWGILNAENGFASAIRQVEICIHILFIYVTSQFLTSRIQKYIILGGVAVTLLYTCFHFSILRLVIGDQPYDWVSNIPFYANIRHWGYLQVAALPLAYLGFNSQIRLIKLGAYAFFFVACTSVIFAGGRGSLLAVVISITVFAPILLKTSIKQYSATVLLFVIAIWSATFIEGNDPSLSIKRLFFLDDITDNRELDINRTSSSRIGIYKDSLREVWEKHPLTGLGPDNYRYSLELKYHKIPTQPHSIIIQAVYEYGIIGIAILISIFLLLIRVWLNQNSAIHKTALLALLCTGIASVFDGHFYHSSSLLQIALIISVLCSSVVLRPSRLTTRTIKENILQNKALLSLTLPLVISWGMHIQTFYQYAIPLTSEEQLEKVNFFPSIAPTSLWIGNTNSNELLKQAIVHGYHWSDMPCPHMSLLKLRFDEDLPPKGPNCKFSSISKIPR